MLVFGLFVSSCTLNNDNNNTDKNYTIEFKIKNQRYLYGGTVTKIEFINGETIDDSVLQTQNVNIAEGETSEIFKISGFNKELQPNLNLFIGVKLTYNNDSSDIVFSSTLWSNKDRKCLVQSTAFVAKALDFLVGNW